MAPYEPLIAELERAIGDPHLGLPEPVFLFLSRIAPLVNVDLLIKDNGGRTLLTWRHDQHYGPGWHIPGGVIRYKETAADRIKAVAALELGAAVDFDPAPIRVLETISPDRDRAHAISLLYRCRFLTAPDPSLEARSNPQRAGAWRWHASAPADLLTVHRPYAEFF